MSEIFAEINIFLLFHYKPGILINLPLTQNGIVT